MAYRYEFLEAAARDVFKVTRHDIRLLHALLTVHIPKLLEDPLAVGEPKKGDLSGFRAYNLNFPRVAYRLVYTVDADVVRIIAFGPHDDAYQNAARRLPTR